MKAALFLALAWCASGLLRSRPLRSSSSNVARRRAAVAESTTTAGPTVASTPEEYEAAADLCAECFPASTKKRHASVLRDPGCLANIFFNVRGEPSVGVLISDGQKIMGCAQLVPCAVRREASEAAIGRRSLWVQCVCVDPAQRRSGVATRLMAWAEEEASAAARNSRCPDVELWLAVAEDNAAALKFYEKLGFDNVSQDKQSHGHNIMFKKVTVTDTAAAGERGAASRFDLIAPLQKAALTDFVAPHILFSFVAVLGMSALVAPLAYAGASSPQIALFADAFDFHLEDALLGLSAAGAAELLRRQLSSEEEDDVLAELRKDPSLVAQKRELWRLCGGTAGAASVASIAIWQLCAALGEELYYRGLLQSGVARALGHAIDNFSGVSLSAALPYETIPVGAKIIADSVALLVATAAFSAAHTGWVDPADADADAQRMDWLKNTAPFGAMLGALFALTNHRLLAPVVAHAALNTYWCAVDMAKLAKLPRYELAQIFDDEKEQQDKQSQQSPQTMTTKTEQNES